MKTTLILDDSVMEQLRRQAARAGHTMSEIVESALRRYLSEKEPAAELPPLPSFRCGGGLVDIANRDALYHAMEGR